MSALCSYNSAFVKKNFWHFYVGGYLNKQNCRICKSQNWHLLVNACSKSDCFVLILGMVASLANFDFTVNGEHNRGMFLKFFFQKLRIWTWTVLKFNRFEQHIIHSIKKLGTKFGNMELSMSIGCLGAAI